MNRVPMVDLCARHERVADVLEPQLLKWIRGGRYVGGPAVERCESAVAERFGRAHGVGVASGTDALALSLRALGVTAGDEVLIPALSFFATAGAVLHLGARPIVVDVLEEQPLMDPDAAVEALTPRTKAAIVVHLYGGRCAAPNVDVPIIEDSAQAAGQTPPARAGCLTAVSFYPTKTLGGAGEGGMVATDDSDLAGRVRALGNHGHVAGALHLHERVSGHVGINSRLDPIQALVVSAHLADLSSRIERRQRLANAYDDALPDAAQKVVRESGHPVHQYVLRSGHRAALIGHLDQAGIDSAIYYPRSLASQPAVVRQPPTPIADRWAAELLALPCHVGISDESADRICDALASFRA